MNINASPDTIRAAAAAIARAALFDDRITDGDDGRTAAWAEALEEFHFDQADVLAAVTKHYQAKDAPTIRVGDIIAISREIRRARGLRENAEDILDRPGITNGDPAFGGLPLRIDGKPVKAAYENYGEIDIECPRCKSVAGEYCWNPTTERDRKIPCLDRIKAGKQLQDTVAP